jgi:hypothetical protein
MADPALCPFCGAYSTRSCDLIDDAGQCPWEEMDEAEPYCMPEPLDPDAVTRPLL